jgi:hypothetical protein
VAEFERRLAMMVEGGFAMPVVEYYHAVAAILRDDVAAADAALGRAIARGWLDRVALETDLPWRALTGQRGFEAHRAAMRTALAAMRTRSEEAAPGAARP